MTPQIQINSEMAKTIVHFLRQVTPRGHNDTELLIHCVEHLENALQQQRTGQ